MTLTKTFIALLSIFTFFFSPLCNCQNTFEFTIKDTLTDQVINDAVELEDGSFILLAHEVFPANHSKAHLLRLSRSGILIQSKTVVYMEKSSTFLQIIKLEPNLFVLSGITHIPDSNRMWLYEMDSLFNEVRSKIFPTGNYDFSYTCDLTVNNNNIICSGVVETSPTVFYRFIYKISPTFDSLQFRVFTEHISPFEIDLLVKSYNRGYYAIIPNFGPPANVVIADLDTSFAIKHIYGVPNDVSHYPEAKWINSATFILAVKKDIPQYPPESPYQRIEVMCLDTLGNLIHDHFIGTPDTVEWPGLRSRLDYIDTNVIYVGGTHNFCQASEFCPVNCWFSLNQMDSLLNVHWEHFYGGDANYTMYGIRATKDKGCLMFGSRYDLQATNPERDIYVIKVDQNGIVTGTGDQPDPKFHHAIVFPNPGKDYLIVESGSQIQGSEMIMYDMQGNQVFHKIIQSPHIEVNTRALPCGAYLWQIMNEEKVIEKGRWIKL